MKDLAREISWIPVHHIDFSHDMQVSYLDRMKGFVEDHLAESWDWWPLGPRLRPLEAGFCRLQWKTVRSFSF